MPRKVQKTKASDLKASTSTRNGTKSTKSEEKDDKLSMTIKVTNNKKTEIVTKMEANGCGEEINDKENDTMDSNENVDSGFETQENNDTEIEESAKQEEPEEMKPVTSSEMKKTTKSRKRKAANGVTEKTAVKTKSKKQKVLLEIPKISSITGKIFVIGDNAIGQLGLGEDVIEKKRPALLDLPESFVDIAAGGMHSVCLTEGGEVITFGCNDEGALGRITTDEGSEYIPRRVDIPERIVQVSAGDSHSAALSEDGQVYIWGNFRNNNGPMGLVKENTIQVSPIKILNNVRVVKIASGSDHLACLSEAGVVYTCGNGEVGQLGRVSEHSSVNGGRKGRISLITPDVVPVNKSSKTLIVSDIWTGSYATFLNIQQGGSVYAFGLNNHSQLGLENQTTIWKPKQVASFNSRTWTHINGGQHHTLALDNDGLVHALGRSEYGRLGLGEDSSEKSVPTVIPTLEDKNCIDIACGNCVSFALTDNGSAYSWGMGTNFQLGHGNDNDQHTPQLIEGNFTSWKAFKIAGGGQHTLMLAHPRNSSENSQ